MGRTEKTIQQEKLLETLQIWKELKQLQIKKLCAKIDFSIVKMVSFQIPMKTLRADLEKFMVVT